MKITNIKFYKINYLQVYYAKNNIIISYSEVIFSRSLNIFNIIF